MIQYTSEIWQLCGILVLFQVPYYGWCCGSEETIYTEEGTNSKLVSSSTQNSTVVSTKCVCPKGQKISCLSFFQMRNFHNTKEDPNVVRWHGGGRDTIVAKAGIDEEKWANNKGVTQKRRRILIYKKTVWVEKLSTHCAPNNSMGAKQKRSKGTARMRLKKQERSLICLAGLFELFFLCWQLSLCPWLMAWVTLHMAKGLFLTQASLK